MPLGSLDRTPPPLFRQGVSALTKLGLYSAAALFLMVADTRLGLTGPLRNALTTALLPMQQVMGWPLQASQRVNDYLTGLDGALERERLLREALVLQSAHVAQADAWWPKTNVYGNCWICARGCACHRRPHRCCTRPAIRTRTKSSLIGAVSMACVRVHR